MQWLRSGHRHHIHWIRSCAWLISSIRFIASHYSLEPIFTSSLWVCEVSLSLWILFVADWYLLMVAVVAMNRYKLVSNHGVMLPNDKIVGPHMIRGCCLLWMDHCWDGAGGRGHCFFFPLAVNNKWRWDTYCWVCYWGCCDVETSVIAWIQKEEGR